MKQETGTDLTPAKKNKQPLAVGGACGPRVTDGITQQRTAAWQSDAEHFTSVISQIFSIYLI